MLYVTRCKSKGFTLIELLVVIAIIGVLSGIVYVSVKSGIKSARMAKRISFSAQVHQALGAYEQAGYTFDDGTAWDETGIGNDGQLINYASITNGVNNSKGLIDNGGGTAVINVATAHTKFSSAARTIEAWVKPAGGGVDTNINIYTDQNAKLFYSFSTSSPFFFGDSKVIFSVSAFGVHCGAQINDNFKFDADEWNHILATFDGNTQTKIYVNSDLISNSYMNCNSSITIFTNPPVADMQIGYDMNGFSHGSALDQVRIYDSFLDLAH